MVPKRSLKNLGSWLPQLPHRLSESALSCCHGFRLSSQAHAVEDAEQKTQFLGHFNYSHLMDGFDWRRVRENTSLRSFFRSAVVLDVFQVDEEVPRHPSRAMSALWGGMSQPREPRSHAAQPEDLESGSEAYEATKQKLRDLCRTKTLEAHGSTRC